MSRAAFHERNKSAHTTTRILRVGVRDKQTETKGLEPYGRAHWVRQKCRAEQPSMFSTVAFSAVQLGMRLTGGLWKSKALRGAFPPVVTEL